ncbi:hypothetical protein Ahy_A10g049988 [Arachis hypogaea]|uniref:Protein FAR1-RELATED SEQUENCE n=1 Tax=Arachis hypogaea TaxID=3818 RepID=A0A445B8C9_ARAHY|nr:hypothetical protein Ahy_A10g049988 [Arachis hypogaea]
MLKQHRELNMFVCRIIEINEEARIRPSKIYQSFVAVAGSHCELSFYKKDVRNYMTKEVRNISEQDDAKEFGKYLLRMKEKNQNFFFELNLEGDHCIKHALWADVRSRAACEYFGDVVSFETTYNTNRYSVQSLIVLCSLNVQISVHHGLGVYLCKYNLVLGSFVGVNHYGQSTLLRCTLMKSEDIQSFKWLSECWLRCMGGKAPKGILTDQCASIQRATEVCRPTTIHRWCIWHIMKKIPNKLNGYKRHDKINQDMNHVVWNLYTKDVFDRNWNNFITKYGLEDNKWLFGSPYLIGSVYYAELYEDRHIWILIYLDHHFWAGMKSTQRSESMHSFFNKFITRNSSLRQFMKQYDNCLVSREQAEREFDAVNFHTVIPCAIKSAIEAQFQHVYTHEKFKEVQAQFRGKVNCITRSMHSTLGFTTYEVVEQVFYSTFNKGILCRHSLSILSFERVDNVAPKYILERWSKNIKRNWCFSRTIYANLHPSLRS